MSNSVEDVGKVLGEPIATDFTEPVRKIRTNLLIISVISIAVVLGGIEIDPRSPFFGIQFTGLNNGLILKGLLALNIYMLIHFAWCSFDSLLEWFTRLSGTRVTFVTTGRFASEEGDYPTDPRQSTLYNWWKDQAKQIGSFRAYAAEIDKKLSEWELEIKAALENKDPNVVAALMSINRISQDLTKLTGAVEKAEKTIRATRIPASLARFDSCFQLLLRSQNLRWLTIELFFPLIAGGYAIALLLTKLSF